MSREVNLSLAEWRVMAHIRFFGKLTISQISRSAFVDRAEVCRAAATLEKAGVVRREVNPGNRRSQLLELTPKGETLFLITSEGRIALLQGCTCVERQRAPRDGKRPQENGPPRRRRLSLSYRLADFDQGRPRDFGPPANNGPPPRRSSNEAAAIERVMPAPDAALQAVTSASADPARAEPAGQSAA